jgi:CheY-like chemotaxis protein
VEVQDNGSGVEQAQQALIFEKFRQGGTAAGRPQGTGLGLPISRQIVEHLAAASGFEALQAVAPASRSAYRGASHRRLQFPHARRMSWSGRVQTKTETFMSHKVLIADDEPNILISLEFLMKREGYDVVVVRDGQQAMEAIVRDHPDLVLLDVMMPVKSGFDVCQEVRATDGIRDIPILMLTAKGRDTDIAKGMAMGATAYMTKPFSTREMARRVREMLERPV